MARNIKISAIRDLPIVIPSIGERQKDGGVLERFCRRKARNDGSRCEPRRRNAGYRCNHSVGKDDMTKQVNQAEINQAVWAACDTFRGTVDPSIYKDFILAMLFLKFLSDVWSEHYEQYEADCGYMPGLTAEMMKNQRFVLPEGASFYDIYRQRHAPGNGERIDKALHAIEEANITKLHDVFQDISFNSTKLGTRNKKMTCWANFWRTLWTSVWTCEWPMLATKTSLGMPANT